MTQTKEGAAKARAKLVEKYGGEEGYQEHMRQLGNKGGKVKVPKGFAAIDRAKLIEVSAKGGKAYRRLK